MEAIAKNCRGLKKFPRSQCTFAAKGVNAILNNCGSLEELSGKRLPGLTDETVFDLIGPGVVGDSLRTILLKELYNGPSYYPLIIRSKNLRTLRLMKC
ncbi:hypothetical protein CDL15_Pgr006699 [Punica granatum]|uniref:NB-ARC domain-containing protein n=1 Tax=Punica granatum TaxID=22663 RepID=A0A218X7K8_PUNGR|nr:hypothetical protein CDL15_Pgr006699 [Punica granatum]